MKKLNKINLLIILVVIIFIILSLGVWFYFYDFSQGKKPVLGVTFVKSYAQQLELDWRETYLAILDDLQVKNIRITAQWDEIEPAIDQYDFSDLDWQMSEAQKRDVQVVLAIGRRTPRWPECHDPEWTKTLTEWKIQREQLQMVEDLVKHFQKYDNIKYWQVENEPFLTSFGDCPDMLLDFLKKEVALVKSLDDRPVLITDSGELSTWFKTADLGDKFGHTVYRLVYNDLFGYSHYYLPPAFYRLKAMLAGLDKEDVIVAELQAEPWLAKGYILQTDYEKMLELMNLPKVQSNYNFARKTGASEIYFWGVEWWYWLKTNAENDSFWQFGQEIFLQN